jgi:hypothetical protein
VLPGLSAQLINTAQSPEAAMADWLVSGEPPTPFTIDRDCELKAADGEKPVVRYARHALDLPEIREHIAAGKRPTRLALTWNGRVSFTLTESLQLKKIAFLDGVFEGRVADGDEGFDANAAIATGELAPMIGELIDALGGEQVFGEAAVPGKLHSSLLGETSPVEKTNAHYRGRGWWHSAVGISRLNADLGTAPEFDQPWRRRRPIASKPRTPAPIINMVAGSGTAASICPPRISCVRAVGCTVSQ